MVAFNPAPKTSRRAASMAAGCGICGSGIGSTNLPVWLAAGPAINLALAVASAAALHAVFLVPAAASEWAAQSLINSVRINVILAVFNMLPLPPLDGGRVAVGLLPRRLAYPLARLERYGMFILIGIIFILPLVARQLGYALNPFVWIVGVPADWLMRVIAAGVGIG